MKVVASLGLKDITEPVGDEIDTVCVVDPHLGGPDTYRGIARQGNVGDHDPLRLSMSRTEANPASSGTHAWRAQVTGWGDLPADIALVRLYQTSGVIGAAGSLNVEGSVWTEVAWAVRYSSDESVDSDLDVAVGTGSSGGAAAYAYYASITTRAGIRYSWGMDISN